MIRLFVALVALAAVSGFLFVHPAPLNQVSRQPLLGSIVVAHRPPRTSLVPLPPLPTLASADPSGALSLQVDAGSTANPPRHLASGAPHRLQRGPTLLQLPRMLPARTMTVPILMYHHISSRIAASQLDYGLTVSDTDFAAQLDYLQRRGYHTILLRQLFAALYQHSTLPSHPIVLTFDDGYLDNYTDALPILLHYHDVAEFNIISAYPGITLGTNTYMTWKQIKQLVADGMEIGSQTMDHQDLGTMPEDHVRFELRDSRNILQKKLGITVQIICYPSGAPFNNGSVAAQQLLLTLLPKYGYVGGLLDGPASTSVQHTRQPYQLNRIRVWGGESLDAFAGSLPW